MILGLADALCIVFALLLHSIRHPPQHTLPRFLSYPRILFARVTFQISYNHSVLYWVCIVLLSVFTLVYLLTYKGNRQIKIATGNGNGKQRLRGSKRLGPSDFYVDLDVDAHPRVDTPILLLGKKGSGENFVRFTRFAHYFSVMHCFYCCYCLLFMEIGFIFISLWLKIF